MLKNSFRKWGRTSQCTFSENIVYFFCIFRGICLSIRSDSDEQHVVGIYEGG